jgi:hypothetical protein
VREWVEEHFHEVTAAHGGEDHECRGTLLSEGTVECEVELCE